MFKSDLTKSAFVPIAKDTFKILPSAFVIGVKIDKEGNVYQNGFFNTEELEALPLDFQLRFTDFCRGMVLAILEHNHIFEMLGKQERSDMMKFIKTMKPEKSFLIERLKDTNVVKVEFGKNEKEV